jgi:hypothetical protein
MYETICLDLYYPSFSVSVGLHDEGQKTLYTVLDARTDLMSLLLDTILISIIYL